ARLRKRTSSATAGVAKTRMASSTNTIEDVRIEFSSRLGRWNVGTADPARVTREGNVEGFGKERQAGRERNVWQAPRDRSRTRSPARRPRLMRHIECATVRAARSK